MKNLLIGLLITTSVSSMYAGQLPNLRKATMQAAEGTEVEGIVRETFIAGMLYATNRYLIEFMLDELRNGADINVVVEKLRRVQHDISKRLIQEAKDKPFLDDEEFKLVLPVLELLFNSDDS